MSGKNRFETESSAFGRMARSKASRSGMLMRSSSIAAGFDEEGVVAMVETGRLATAAMELRRAGSAAMSGKAPFREVSVARVMDAVLSCGNRDMAETIGCGVRNGCFVPAGRGDGLSDNESVRIGCDVETVAVAMGSWGFSEDDRKRLSLQAREMAADGEDVFKVAWWMRASDTAPDFSDAMGKGREDGVFQECSRLAECLVASGTASGAFNLSGVLDEWYLMCVRRGFGDLLTSGLSLGWKPVQRRGVSPWMGNLSFFSKDPIPMQVHLEAALAGGFGREAVLLASFLDEEGGASTSPGWLFGHNMVMAGSGMGKSMLGLLMMDGWMDGKADTRFRMDLQRRLDGFDPWRLRMAPPSGHVFASARRGVGFDEQKAIEVFLDKAKDGSWPATMAAYESWQMGMVGGAAVASMGSLSPRGV